MHKATIPVSVRLQAMSLPTERLAHNLASRSQDISVKERFKRFTSGEIEGIRDFIFCEDLISEHRKNLRADKSGVYSNVLAKRRESSIAAIISANPSVATASNIAIISRETADELERMVNGKLSNPKVRERVFENTSLMLLNVVDAADSRVTIYSRGIAYSTEVGARDLRSVNAGSGPNVSDVLKAYQLGNSPSL